MASEFITMHRAFRFTAQVRASNLESTSVGGFVKGPCQQERYLISPMLVRRLGQKRWIVRYYNRKGGVLPDQ